MQPGTYVLTCKILKWFNSFLKPGIHFCVFFFLDLSHMETRVQMFLDGFQIHVYNKVGTYDRLDKLFGSTANLNDPVEENTNTKSRSLWLKV